MKRTHLALLGAIVCTVAQVEAAVKLDNEARKAGYAIGADMGNSLAQLGGEDRQALDFNALIIGLRDAYEQRDMAMSQDEMTQTMQDFAKKRMEQMQRQIREEAEKNAAAGKAFLEKNAKSKDVKTTPSGLQYKVQRSGKGEKPGPNDTVTVEYVGKLIDGTVFDSSEKHGDKPVTFNVQDVIPGWVEGLQLMNEGSKYTFYVPADLAYGMRGAGPAIPANSTLIFEVDLQKVEAAKKTDEATEKAAAKGGHEAENETGGKEDGQ